jgi:uncharacterized protein YjbJ (UPF0337 family)
VLLAAAVGVVAMGVVDIVINGRVALAKRVQAKWRRRAEATYVTAAPVLAQHPRGIPLMSPLRGELQPIEGKCIMGAEDKARNKVQNLGGKAKEAAGRATGDRDTEDRGRADQAKSNLKDAGEKIKDAFKK